MVHRFLVILAVIPTIAFAEDESKVALVSDPFNEVTHEAAQISGARLVGLMAAGIHGPGIRVAAMIPKDWRNEQVCLKVVSADGLYEAYNIYTVAADWTGGTIVLSYPSGRPDLLAAIPGELISGMLQKGACEAAAKEAAPVFWGEDAHGSVRVLLNTARADETYLAFPNYPEHGDVACQPVSALARNAFDVACPIPEALAALDRLDAIALSFKNGEMGQEEQIVLRLGPGQ
ncbi:MAG: hypothetical protein ACK4HF_04540 [Paracoccaceae bacterium]